MKAYAIDDAITRINDFGIPMKRYARPPMGKNLLIIGIGDRYKKSERICIWPGLVKNVELATDRRYNQAVLGFYEESRKVTVGASVPAYWDNTMNRDWRGYVDMVFPDGTRLLKVEDTGLSSKLVWSWPRNEQWLKKRFTVRTPSAERWFLLGSDSQENHVFISMLPERATSVREAHEILRPKEVPKGSPRQGEFFFVRAPDEADILLRSIPYKIVYEDHGIWSVLAPRKTPKSGWQYDHHLSDHKAEELLVDWPNGVQYVHGTISNTRHKPLHLKDWHRVVMNREIPNPAPPGRGTRWD